MKNKKRTYGDTDFCGLNVLQDGVECEYFTIGSLLVYENKYNLQVYLDNCDYKNINKQIVDYLGDNLFESD